METQSELTQVMDQAVQSQVAPETTEKTVEKEAVEEVATGLDSLKKMSKSKKDSKKETDTTLSSQSSVDKDEWKPNYKYKVLDSEYDMEDWVKDLVKTKEQEEKLKTLFSRGHGIEDIKAERQKLREVKEELEGKYTNLTKALNTVSGYVQNGQLGQFFKSLNIPEQLVTQYVIDQIKRQSLPPEQQAEIARQEQQQEQVMQYGQQNEALTQQIQQLQIAQTTQELNYALSEPSVAQVAKAFDERIGQPGAFRNEVINRGAILSTTTGQDVTVKQAVDEVIRLIGTVHSGSTPAPVAATSQAPQTQAAKPVIPNIGGKSTTPVKKAPESIDDLRKLRASMMA